MTDVPHIPTQFVAPDDAPPPETRVEAELCPDSSVHGHPYRYCPYCDWMEGAEAEAAPEQHDRPEDPGRPYVDDAPERDAERDAEAVAATPAAPAPPSGPVPPPVPLAAGTYAVYDDGNGGVVLVIQTSEGETHHKQIPAKVIKMGEMMLGGSNPLAALFGG